MPSSKAERQKFWREGEHFIWLSALGVGLILFMVLGLLLVVLQNGAGAFWPSSLQQFSLTSGEQVLGEVTAKELHPHSKELRYQLKTGNRDLYGLDFRWIEAKDIASSSSPKNAIALERSEYGNFYGYLVGYQSPLYPTQQTDPQAKQAIEAALAKDAAAAKETAAQVQELALAMESLSTNIAEVKYRQEDPRELEAQLELLKARFNALMQVQEEAQVKLASHVGVFQDAQGSTKEIPLAQILRRYYPNDMGVFAKTGHYLAKLWELFFDEPRESNTEGGLFPAIIGTVMLILTMSVFSFPLGVIAAIYMKEYARPGFLLQAIRIAVNNLAGVPSIVWGIFGLSFFVYGIGTGIDGIFFPERLPTPTFGTGGVLWASLTLALLTVPVVIVATEEALSSVPADIRHGSLALGATKFQTLMRVTIPMASPRIITGFILAMSRAAGEVAPLMITGVVKLAPSLPIDGQFPFVHLERKFMHLGFHIYDVGFQSPNVEAAKPMVFVTTLLLLGIVIVLASSSIYLRNRIRKKYESRAF